MRLLSIMNRIQLALLLLVLVLWTGVLYFVMRWEVYDNIDEVLTYRKGKLIEDIRSDKRIPENSKYYDFEIYRVDSTPRNASDSFKDTLVYKTAKSFDEYRRITSHFEFEGAFYKMNIILPHLEDDELIDTLAYTLPVLAVMILVCFSVVNWRLNKNAWKPFYEILEQFRLFRIEKGMTNEFRQTSIREFTELQTGVKELMSRSTSVYLQQKQFTENASHEIQTPLAIMQSKAELLFQQPLTKRQGDILKDLHSAVIRLAKINETLLLLSRIENNQFTGKTSVNIRSVVDEVIPFFEEQAAKYEIQTQVDISPGEQIYVNATLLGILVTNLLKNAFLHNRVQGRVTIRVENKTMTVTNTGDAIALPTTRVFDRFFTQKPGKGGLGLGLAIVKSICEINNWHVNYHQEDAIHEIAIQY